MKHIIVAIVQKYLLRRIENAKKRHSYVSLDDAKSVGVVFNANDKNIPTTLRYLKKEFRRRNIKISCLAINIDSSQSEFPSIDSDSAISIINSSDLNWYGLPVSKEISKFIKKDFNILIDLSSTQRLFTIDYIISNSNATMKVGLYTHDKFIHDIVICKRENDDITLIDHIKQIVEYLTIIKPL